MAWARKEGITPILVPTASFWMTNYYLFPIRVLKVREDKASKKLKCRFSVKIINFFILGTQKVIENSLPRFYRPVFLTESEISFREHGCYNFSLRKLIVYCFKFLTYVNLKVIPLMLQLSLIDFLEY